MSNVFKLTSYTFILDNISHIFKLDNSVFVGQKNSMVIVEIPHHSSVEATMTVKEITKALEKFYGPYTVCLIKMADRICNVQDFMMQRNDYARKYFEKAAKLPDYLKMAAIRENLTNDDLWINAVYEWNNLEDMLWSDDGWICRP